MLVGTGVRPAAVVADPSEVGTELDAVVAGRAVRGEVALVVLAVVPPQPAMRAMTTASIDSRVTRFPTVGYMP